MCACAPVTSRRHLGATKPDQGPEASPSARHTHDIEFIVSLGSGSERGLPLSAKVMEALDWCNSEDGAGERLDSSVSACVERARTCV